MTTQPSLQNLQITSPARPVPGPRPAPFLGNISQFRKDPLDFLLSLARDFGPVVRFKLGNIDYYQVSHPDGVRWVLQDNNHNYIKGHLYDRMRSLFGNGLIISEGDFWLRQRRLMQPSFHRQRLVGFAEIILRESERVAQRWEQLAQSKQVIDVHEDMMHLTMQVVTQALFSTQVSLEKKVDQAVAVLLEDINFRFQVPFYPSPKVPTPRNRRFLAASRILDELVYGLIAARRDLEKNGQLPPHDLLAMLMDATDADTGERMDDRQLRDEVLTMFTAGYETTSNVLTWTWFLLSQHPGVVEQLEDELDRGLAGRSPQVTDLPNLPYTRMVLEEAMRLYPPGWITSRNVVEDDTILGYRIPAGSVVEVSPYVTHRDPQLWENPNVFDPQRFAPERAENRPHFAYFPFGGGPRKCIGQGFAMMEAQLVLAMLAQRFRLSLAPNFVVQPQPAATLRPKNGMQMTLSLRRIDPIHSVIESSFNGQS